MDERELSRTIKRTRLLENKLHKYMRHLVREGLRIAKDENTSFILKSLPNNYNYIDTSSLIELAKEECPSLYRRYYSSLTDYKDNLLKLRELTGSSEI